MRYNREEKLSKLEETIGRLEQEKAELLVTVQKGEGIDTAIKQLQQDAVSLHLTVLYKKFHTNQRADCKLFLL